MRRLCKNITVHFSIYNIMFLEDLEEEDFPYFFGMSTIIFLTILLFLWILWTASAYMVNKVLFISPSMGYIDDQHTLIQNEIHTDQEEMVVFDIESQFRRH